MVVNGIISKNITGNTKENFGQSHNPKTIFTYSGSIVNNGSNTVTVKLFIQTLSMGETETSFLIPANQIVRFRNLKFNAIQVMTSNPNIYLIAIQFLKPIDEGLKEEPEIFYQ